MMEEEEEPSLPPLSPLSGSEGGNPRKRKQRRGDASPPPPIPAHESSEPAFFSGDDDPGLDNYYVEGRRKKRYVGSWFQQRPTSSDSSPSDGPGPHGAPAPKRSLTRQIDSGIYMGSDETHSDDHGAADDETGLQNHHHYYCSDTSPTTLRRHSYARLATTCKQVPQPTSQAELEAQTVVERCVDRGIESIDLYALGLGELSEDLVGRIAQFTCYPDVTEDAAFEERDPRLQLHLGVNNLTRVPGALFDLTHLTVLSLRGNMLTELPPAVCRLSKLEYLSLYQNRLHSLPAELLDLMGAGGRLRDLKLFPNPFVQPKRRLVFPADDDGFGSLGPGDDDDDDDGGGGGPPAIFSRPVARSPAQVLSSSGTVLSKFRLSLADVGASGLQVFDGDDSSASARPSSVPSLVEAVLRACYRSRHARSLELCTPHELGHLEPMVRRVVEGRAQGGLACSRCRRLVVVPALEWIEWREVRAASKRWTSDGWKVDVGPLSKDETEMAVPFLRRACSWRCGPGE